VMHLRHAASFGAAELGLKRAKTSKKQNDNFKTDAYSMSAIFLSAHGGRPLPHCNVIVVVVVVVVVVVILLLSFFVGARKF